MHSFPKKLFLNSWASKWGGDWTRSSAIPHMQVGKRYLLSQSRPRESSLFSASGLNSHLVYAAHNCTLLHNSCMLVPSVSGDSDDRIASCGLTRTALALGWHGGYITADVANQGHIRTTTGAEKSDANKGRKGWFRPRATQPLPLPPLRLAACFPEHSVGALTPNRCSKTTPLLGSDTSTDVFSSWAGPASKGARQGSGHGPE